MINRSTNLDLLEYSFLILGNSRFGGYYHREQAIAKELAKRRYQVIFIEEMPSFAAELRRKFRSLFSKQAVDVRLDDKEKLDNLNVLRPPLIPTMFRSSFTPIIDKWIFKAWFNSRFSTWDWNRTIVIVTLSYWWNGFLDRNIAPANIIHYDYYDALEMSSRTLKALERMKEGERAIAKEVNIVTYSAQSMAKEIRNNFPLSKNLCLLNGISEEFIKNIKTKEEQKTSRKKRIVYLGSLDPRWADRELVVKIAKDLPNYEVIIRASVNKGYAQILNKYENVKLIGILNYIQLTEILTSCDIGIIPFKNNAITRVVNPLKLYEYFAAGLPVVAMRTEELQHYRDLIYLADTHEEFMRLIIRALDEDTNDKHNERQEWAKMNTWKYRVDEYLSFLKKAISSQ